MYLENICLKHYFLLHYRSANIRNQNTKQHSCSCCTFTNLMYKQIVFIFVSQKHAPGLKAETQVPKSKDWKIRAQSCSSWSQHRFCFFEFNGGVLGPASLHTRGWQWKHHLKNHWRRKRCESPSDNNAYSFSKPPLSTQVLIQLRSLWC